MDKLLINSIYLATEGEGIWLGIPQVFVRLQGCSLKCKNCDSVDTWSFTREEDVHLSKILDIIEDVSGNGLVKRVSITGGDPLDARHLVNVVKLANELKLKKYTVTLEASGNTTSFELFTILDFINFDFKTPSSGISTSFENVQYMAKNFRGKFQVKSVINSKADFDYVYNNFRKINAVSNIDFPWILTPAYNLKEEFPLERFRNVLKWNEQIGGVFRVIGQQHKWVFGPDKKQV